VQELGGSVLPNGQNEVITPVMNWLRACYEVIALKYGFGSS
jgi:hypothetical protein